VEGLQIRNATLQDLPGVAAVQRDADRPPTDPVQFAADIADPDRHIVVAQVGELLVGWAKTHYWPVIDGIAPAGHYLGGVTVAPTWRRNGVGSALTQSRIAWVRERADEVYYFANAQNTASLDLHRAWGFEEIGRASRIRGVEFTGGQGLLLRSRLRGDG
jgi:aminoglycoside 6'-N-acetyltransferase I